MYLPRKMLSLTLFLQFKIYICYIHDLVRSRLDHILNLKLIDKSIGLDIYEQLII